MTVEAGLFVARFGHYAAALVLFGLALFPLYAVRGPTPERLARFLRRGHRLVAAIALCAALAWFLTTTLHLTGGLTLEGLQTVAETGFGRIWLVRIALCMVAVLAAHGRVALSAVLLASLALTGHAGASNSLAQQVADAAHLLAAGAWLGGLVGLGYLVARLPQTAGAREAVRRFSGMGYAAVAVLVLSGAFAAWRLIGSPGALISTTYGQLLIAKLGLFGLMIGLAALNRFHLTPRISEAGTLARLRLHVAGEQALGLAVVAAVAALGMLDPSG